MSKKIIVTGGAKGADIDVLACTVAYAEFLRLEGFESIPVVAGKFTSSVTPSILEWGVKYESHYIPDGTENFVLVDISDPEHFPSFVNQESITEVYDHRSGHEGYWKEKLADGFHIEMVGACGTLIWEEYKKRNTSNQISRCSARLLLASVVSNNLNFKSPLLTDRDCVAYDELQKITDLPCNWIEQYFLEQENVLMNDFETYMNTDTKVFKIGSDDFAIGQIELWDANNVLKNKKEEIDAVMKTYNNMPWVVNILNISNGFNYIYSTSEKGKKILGEKMNIVFHHDLATTDELVMRKHMMKILRG